MHQAAAAQAPRPGAAAPVGSASPPPTFAPVRAGTEAQRYARPTTAPLPRPGRPWRASPPAAAGHRGPLLKQGELEAELVGRLDEAERGRAG